MPKKVPSIPRLKPKNVLTPGSYAVTKAAKRKGISKKVGQPSSIKKKAKLRSKAKHRETYTETDMAEAIRLVQEEGYTILSKCQTLHIYQYLSSLMYSIPT